MKIVLQRVLSAGVSVNDEIIGEIGLGLLVLLGIGPEDSEKTVEKMTEKIKNLRIFEDKNGKTNLSSDDVGAELLVVSQFTLYADCKKGNRPAFTGAAKPDLAKSLYEYFLKNCEGKFRKVQHGEFGADMEITLKNDGPFTLVLDSDIWQEKE